MVIVDAGHGGTDPGSSSGDIIEKDYTLKIANYMYNRFKDLGIPDEEDKPINKSLMNWVKDKLSEGLSRGEIIKKAKNTFGSTRDEIKDIIKKLK